MLSYQLTCSKGRLWWKASSLFGLGLAVVLWQLLVFNHSLFLCLVSFHCNKFLKAAKVERFCPFLHCKKRVKTRSAKGVVPTACSQVIPTGSSGLIAVPAFNVANALTSFLSAPVRINVLAFHEFVYTNTSSCFFNWSSVLVGSLYVGGRTKSCSFQNKCCSMCSQYISLEFWRFFLQSNLSTSVNISS